MNDDWEEIKYQSPYGIRNINLSVSTVVYTVYQSPYAQPTYVGRCTFASESGIRNS